jgi:hypothetical protein
MTKTRQLVVMVRGLLSIAALLLVVVEPVLAQETNASPIPATNSGLPIEANRFILDGWFPGGDTRDPIETLELERAMYTHASPRRDPGDQYPNPRDPQGPRR